MIGFKEYINEVKMKDLNIPLTDSEIKKLEALEKRMEKGKKTRRGVITGRDALGRDEELYDNLKARESVPQKDYELANVKQIIQSGRVISAARALRTISKNSKPDINNLKYCAKNQKLSAEQLDAFIEEYKDTMINMYKGKPFRNAVIDTIRRNFDENDYNKRIPSRIVNWIFSIIEKADIDMLVATDGYKIYQDVEIEDKSEFWTSRQGAQMETKKADVVFHYDKDYKENFELDTSGYWND